MKKIMKSVLAWVLTLAVVVSNVEYVSAAVVVSAEKEAKAEAVVLQTDESEQQQVLQTSAVAEGTGDGTGDGRDVSDGDVSGGDMVEVLYSGEVNGIVWEVTSDGVLTIAGKYNFESVVEDSSPWTLYDSFYTKAVITAENVTSTHNWFYYCTELTEVDLSGFDTSNVVDMSQMFYQCKSLTKLDVSGFDTSNVVDMSDMFHMCENLSVLDVSGFDTSNVTDMSNLFNRCRSLEYLDVRGFDTSNVTNMSSLFYGCDSLDNLDVSGFDTSEVTLMNYMFGGCYNLSSVDVSGFNTSNVTRMYAMFKDCRSLVSVDVSGFDTSKVNSMDYMFSGCYCLQEVDVSCFDTSNVVGMYGMFEFCGDLKNLDVSNFNTSKVTDMGRLFANCESVKSLDVSNFDTSNTTRMEYMFYACESVQSLDISGFDTSKVTKMGSMFGNCRNLTELDVSGFDTSNVIDMSGMFWGCDNMAGLDLSGFNTSKVTSMAQMFNRCSSLTTLDLSSFDTSQVINMYQMFMWCDRLMSLDISGFDASNVEYASGMFGHLDSIVRIKCMPGLQLDVEVPTTMTGANGTVYDTYMPKGLTEGIWLYAGTLDSGVIDGLRWYVTENGGLYITGEYTGDGEEVTVWPWHAYNTSVTKVSVDAVGVTTTAHWFEGFSELTAVDLLNFDSSLVRDTQSMFQGCRKLVALDVSMLDMSSVANADYMFSGCRLLTRIKVFENLEYSIELPTEMYKIDGEKYTKYTEFPLCEEESFWVYEADGSGNINGLTWLILPNEYLYISGRNTSTEVPDADEYPWRWAAGYRSYYNKVIVDAQNVLSTAHWFEGCSNIAQIDVSAFDTSTVTDATDMFKGCSGLKQIKPFKNLSLSVELPQAMYDMRGNQYIECPFGVTEDVWLYSFTYAGAEHGISWIISDETTLIIGGADTSTEAVTTKVWPWHEHKDKFTKVVVYTKNVKSTAYWFENCSNIESVDVTEFATGTVTDMSYMFRGCTGLERLDLSGIDTGQVRNMSGMFTRCSALSELKLDNLNTANVTNMGYLFYGCSRLSELKLDSFDTANVADMSAMFMGCSNLTNLDLSHLNTAKVTDMSQMFSGCSGLKTLNVSAFNTASVTSMRSMFNDCGRLQRVDVSGFDTALVRTMSSMFSGCSSLTTLDVSGFDTTSLTDITYAFHDCKALMELDMGAFDLAQLKSADHVFDDCESLVSIHTPLNLNLIINLPVSLVDDEGVEYTRLPQNLKESVWLQTVKAKGVYYGMDWTVLIAGKLIVSGNYTSHADTDTFWGDYAEDIKVAKIDVTGVKSTSKWFAGMSGLETVELINLDTSLVTDMSDMFNGCSVLTGVDISGFVTGNTTDFSRMFKDCQAFTKMDLTQLDFSKAVSVQDMVSGCVGIQEIRIPANFALDLSVPKPLYNYLGEVQTEYFPKNQPEAEWYYAESPVNEGELHVSKVYPQTYTGKAIKPEIRVYDGATRLVEKKDYTIKYKNNKNVNDASDEAKAPTIIVKGKGNYIKQETITFPILAKNLADEDVTVKELVALEGKKVQLPVPKLTYNGKKLVKGKDFDVSYPDLEDKTKVDAYKVAGTYSVLVTGKGNFTGTRNLVFTITDGTLMSKVKVAKIAAEKYTGKEIKPEIKVTHGKKTLLEGTDYAVSYKNNKEIGKATVVVTGLGDYAGTKTATFQIYGQSIAKAQITGLTDKVYNGREQTQKIQVVLDGKTLPNNGYTVSYSKNVNVGKATITVTGKGAYSGTVKKTFQITSYDLDENSKKLFTGVPKSLTVTYEKGGSKPALDLMFAGAAMTAKKDYTISYSNNKAVTKESDAKKPVITIKGKGNFKGTVTIPFTIVAKDLRNVDNPVTLKLSDVPYSAKAGKYVSKPVLTDSNGKKLAAGTDYEKKIVYIAEDGTELDKKSVVEAGKTVKVIITAKGNYTGTMEATYKITPAAFKNAKIEIEPQVYTGKGVILDKDDCTVTMDGMPLTYGVHYEIVEGSYKNNVKKGTASVTVKGLDNYGGEKTVKFKIVPKELIWFWRLFG